MNDGVSIGDPELLAATARDPVHVEQVRAQKIWIMGADGRNPRQLIADEGAEASPAWSPDGSGSPLRGRRVANLISGSSPRTGPGCARSRTTRRTSVRQPGLRTEGDGLHVEPRRFADVWIVPLRVVHRPQLTEKTNAGDETRFAASWSPDGRMLAYVSNRSDYFADDLWVVDVQSKVTAGCRLMFT